MVIGAICINTQIGVSRTSEWEDIRQLIGTPTVLLVQQNFHLFDVKVLHGIAYLALRIGRSQIAVHETARGTFVHQIRSQITGEFRKPIIGIDDRIVDDLSIGQNEGII